jgi:hypothetical protein
VKDPGLVFNKQLKLVGDEQNPANVVIEMSGSVHWTAKGGWIEGVTFRRPKISTGAPPACAMLRLEGEGKVDVVHSVFDNEGSTGSTVTLSGTGSKGLWHDATIRNGGSCGIEMEGQVSLGLTKVRNILSIGRSRPIQSNLIAVGSTLVYHQGEQRSWPEVLQQS